MKFYEKIIGIDKASSHNEMTITFDNGVFKFSQGALSLDGSHGPAINFRNSEVTLSDLDDHTLTFSGGDTQLTFDFYSRYIYSSSSNPINLGSAYHPFTGYFKSIQPQQSGASLIGTLGTDSKRGPEIGANNINSTSADIGTADIDTADINSLVGRVKSTTGTLKNIAGLEVSGPMNSGAAAINTAKFLSQSPRATVGGASGHNELILLMGEVEKDIQSSGEQMTLTHNLNILPQHITILLYPKNQTAATCLGLPFRANTGDTVNSIKFNCPTALTGIHRYSYILLASARV